MPHERTCFLGPWKRTQADLRLGTAECLENVKIEKIKVKITHLCLTLCDPLVCSPPRSSVCGILQARILEWVAIPFSKGSF